MKILIVGGDVGEFRRTSPILQRQILISGSLIKNRFLARVGLEAHTRLMREH